VLPLALMLKRTGADARLGKGRKSYLPWSWPSSVASMGVERIIYTDVARDGMLTGVNLEQTCIIAREFWFKGHGLGGVSSLEDIELLMNAARGNFGAG